MSEPEVDPIGVLVPLGPDEEVSVHSVGGREKRWVVVSYDTGSLTLRLSGSPSVMRHLGREIVRLAEDAL